MYDTPPKPPQPTTGRWGTTARELTEHAQHLAKQLTDVQHELDRVSVAEQVVTQMLAEPEPADYRLLLQTVTRRG
jgi:hypothetical protein